MKSRKLPEVLAQQAAAKSLWEVTRENGDYFMGVSVAADDLARVQELAIQVRKEDRERWNAMVKARAEEVPRTRLQNLLHGMKQVLRAPAPRPLSLAEKELLDRTSYGLLGNLELAQLEIASGLFEPIEDPVGPTTVAAAILDGRYEVSSNPPRSSY